MVDVFLAPMPTTQVCAACAAGGFLLDKIAFFPFIVGVVFGFSLSGVTPARAGEKLWDWCCVQATAFSPKRNSAPSCATGGGESENGAKVKEG
jgi:hypothetical protein